MSRATVILIRHGATAWNETGRYQGRADLPLSAAGRLEAAVAAGHVEAAVAAGHVEAAVAAGHVEAAVAAGRLADMASSRIFASPLRRALETARYLARPRAIPIQPDAALIEIDYGAWEGLTQPEVKRRWPELLRQWKRTPEAVRFPGGESLADARDRLLDFFARLSASLEPGAAVCVVTHQTMIRLAVLERDLRPVSALRDIDAGTATMHRFTVDHGRIRAPTPSPPPQTELTGEMPCASR